MSVEQALDYIKSHSEGVLQSDLWKALKIDSRKCSRIVAKLLQDNLITREQESVNGIRTYRLFTSRSPVADVLGPYWQWTSSSPVQAASMSVLLSTVPSSVSGSSPLYWARRVRQQGIRCTKKNIRRNIQRPEQRTFLKYNLIQVLI